MPQLDLTTYSTLAIYTFLGFNAIYIIISIYLMPAMSFIFKYRYQYLKAFTSKNQVNQNGGNLYSILLTQTTKTEWLT